MQRIFLVGVAVVVAAVAVGAEHIVAVRGKLRCGEYPAATVRIRLWRGKDREVNPKNMKYVLDEGFTDRQGDFRLVGKTAESEFTPLFVIDHDCNDGLKVGQRKFKFQIPKQYIVPSEKAKGTEEEDFAFGELNLEVHLKHNEERDDDETFLRVRKDMHKSPRSFNLTSLDRSLPATASKRSRQKRRQETWNASVELDDSNSDSHSPDDRNDPW